MPASAIRSLSRGNWVSAQDDRTLERAVLASLDYALSAEHQSFVTEDFRAIVSKLNAGKN